MRTNPNPLKLFYFMTFKLTTNKYNGEKLGMFFSFHQKVLFTGLLENIHLFITSDRLPPDQAPDLGNHGHYMTSKEA